MGSKREALRGDEMTEQRFIEFQISLSTAEEEINQPSPSTIREPESEGSVGLEPGLYRVIDGELYRLVPGTATAGE